MQRAMKPPALHTLYTANPSQPPHYQDHLRIISWNVLRGYTYKQLCAYCKDKQIDILLLQEVDWGNARTGYKNIAQEIAECLSMTYVYVPDAEEYSSKKRLFSGKGQGGGVCGNAIISRFSLEDPKVTILPNEYLSHPHLPSRTKIRLWLAPARGQAAAVSATIYCNGNPIRLYSTHFEIGYAGMKTRIRQLETLVEDARDFAHAIIGGDLNTAAFGAFGIYNALENPDAFRMKSIFTPESLYWHDKVLPQTGFADPFDPVKDWTLQLGSIYHAKLDWMLCKGCEAITHKVGPSGYSDHRPLICDIHLRP